MEEELKLISKKLTTVVDIAEITSAFYLNLNSDYKGKYEQHAPIEFVYCDRGSQILYEGTKKYVMNQGQAFIRKPYIEHKDDANNVPFSVYVIDFVSSSSIFESLYGKVFTLNDRMIYNLKDIFEDIKKEELDDNTNGQFIFDGPRTIFFSTTPKWTRQKIKNKLELFFIDLLESIPTSKTDNEIVYSKSTMMIMDEVKKTIYSKFDLEQIANKLYYSKSYLCRKFKEDTGITINQYFYEQKIAEAKMLLLKTDKSLLEVSQILSFESEQYFNFVFRKYVGMSPKHWQKLSSKNNKF